MATQNAVTLTRELLAYTILTDKDSVIRLLEKNGINISKTASDKDVTVATLVASSKSTNFKEDLISLLSKNMDNAANDFSNFSGGNMMFGFTGIDDLAFTGSDDFWKNTTGNLLTYVPKPKANPFMGNLESGSGYKANTLSSKLTFNPNDYGLNTKGSTSITTTKPKGQFLAGIGAFLKENIFTKDNINQGLQIGLSSINNKIQAKSNNVQQEALILQQTQDEMQQNLGQTPKSGMNYLYIGIGVVILGTIGYFIFKKK